MTVTVISYGNVALKYKVSDFIFLFLLSLLSLVLILLCNPLDIQQMQMPKR